MSNNINLFYNANFEIDLIAKRFGWPVVDIFNLYIQINELKYVSDDGLKITPELFYSSDGIFPSALGNAVIANEVIKVTNSFYKTDISLIPIKEYLSK
jgi:lysophospholipase L1-like esterase